jgi:peptide/nickel transport system permease protein
MAVFLARRLVVSALTLLLSTFVVYVLVVNSGDPLGNLRTDTSPGRDAKIAHRIEVLHLAEPVPQRYVHWLAGAAGCAVPGLHCDLGRNVGDQQVATLVGQALGTTVRLVTASLVLALVLGVATGLASSVRQYSGFDHTATVSAFVFFSLPLFWVAVLLKQYVAIDLNDWYAEPRPSPVFATVAAVLLGLAAGALLGGDRRRRWLARATVGAATFAVLLRPGQQDWFRHPALGPVMITLLALVSAVAAAALGGGLGRRAVLVSCLITAAEGSLAQGFVTRWLQDPTWAAWPNVLLALAAALALAGATGAGLGGVDQAAAVRASMLTAAATCGLIVLDLLLRAVPDYARLVHGRVFATIGSQTPDFTGGFWPRQLDLLMHLLLPTLAIALISFASYSRYVRGSMLEVLGQDYVRTARAKGLPESVVVVRHALRNALIPLTTAAAMDFGSLLGGAVITEHVFGWRGMGSLFVDGLTQADPGPVMGFFLVAAVAVMAMNLLADATYAYLDPRIRLT